MRLPLRIGLRGRLVLLLLAVFTALAGVLAWRVVEDFAAQVATAKTELLAEARLLAARQESLTERAEAIVNGLVMTPVLAPGASTEACSRFLAERLKQEPKFVQIAVLRPNGDVVCSAVPLVGSLNVADRPYFQEAKRTHAMIIAEVVIGRVTRKPVIIFSKAARDVDGGVTGVFLLSLDLDWLEEELGKTQLAEGARLAVVDGRGVITARYPDPGSRIGVNVSQLPVIQHVFAKGGEGTIEAASSNGELRVFAYVPLLVTAGSDSYHLFLSLPRRLVVAPARREMQYGMGTLLVALIVSLGWVIAGGNRLLLRPLSVLSQTANRIAAGELDARSGLPHGDDEIGRLAATLDVAAAALDGRAAERRLAEEALRASEERLNRAQRLAHMGNLVRDLRTGVVDWSAEIYRILGVSRDSFGVSPRALLSFTHPADRQKVQAATAQIVAGIAPEAMEHRIIRPDGSVRYVYREWELSHDVAGEPVHLLGTIQDVTERKEAEEALRESEEQLNRAQRLASMGSIHINLQTRKTNWSNETYQIFGVARETFAPSMDNYLPMVHPDDRALARAMQEQVRQGINPAPGEYRIVRPDGTVRWVFRESEIVRDEADSGRLLVSTIRDITEQRRTEEQLRQAQKMDAIGNLTGGMAHDFNNLLAIIIGNIDLLRELKKDDADIAQLTEDALDAAIRGADLTRRLLAFARQQPLQPKRIDVNELVSGITRLLGRTLGEDIEISLNLAPDAWATVVDPAQVEASLVNLANNSRDAMPNGGKLEIVTANRRLDADYAEVHTEVVAGDYVLIEVSDTGTGMTQDVISRVFEPFFTTKEQGKGTGLGLAMIFGFAKQSGGHINVYSEPGIGTTFRLYLPRLTEEVTPTEEDSAPPLVRGGGETILVVEDNAALRRIVVRQLDELGYRVVEAENAPAALELMGQENIDLLLTDIVMPGGIDGIELARQVCQRWPALKAVFTSGFAETQMHGSAWSLSEGARLLVKPYRREELAAIVRAALEM